MSSAAGQGIPRDVSLTQQSVDQGRSGSTTQGWGFTRDVTIAKSSSLKTPCVQSWALGDARALAVKNSPRKTVRHQEGVAVRTYDDVDNAIFTRTERMAIVGGNPVSKSCGAVRTRGAKSRIRLRKGSEVNQRLTLPSADRGLQKGVWFSKKPALDPRNKQEFREGSQL